jgi:hypothetical protein
MTVLRNDINLRIADFSENKEVAVILKPYYDLLEDFSAKRSNQCVIHVPGRYWGI